MSTHQARFGSGHSDASKRRSSVLGATAWACVESVVRTTNRLAALLAIPPAFISRATVFSQTSTPAAFSSAYTRGLP